MTGYISFDTLVAVHHLSKVGVAPLFVCMIFHFLRFALDKKTYCRLLGPNVVLDVTFAGCLLVNDSYFYSNCLPTPLLEVMVLTRNKTIV